MTKTRILLVDDQLLFRKGLRSLLEEQEDFEVVAEGTNGLEGANLARELGPDIVLMDINMPVCDGVEATKIINDDVPSARVVILTVSDEDKELFSAIKAGASGYLLKDLKPDELFDMIRGLMKGESLVSAAIGGRLLREFQSRPWNGPGETNERSLTARELEVLQLVTEGYSNAEIGRKLFIVEGTVKNHLHNILEKLHLENRLQATTYALSEGLVQRPARQSPE
ncbi:MAG: response regulator [Dehalococcoidia bacterium]